MALTNERRRVWCCSSHRCIVVSDEVAGQDIRLEAHGSHAIRVRAVVSGLAFRDDLVSALVPTPPSPLESNAACPTTRIGLNGRRGDDVPPVLTNGNLKAAVGDDGKITFTRVSDGKVLLKEQVRCTRELLFR